ncbi:tripartite tricarboxylate transporter TctB family protein [Nocardiopsis sp. NPDC006139]|uniref:tripartite tricarboxylate transporter TctB family protein n=1 Tax=Nocardiopsis sp. NPDC006139 TaxID=3154578 RepID=UPI0033BAEC77
MGAGPGKPVVPEAGPASGGAPAPDAAPQAPDTAAAPSEPAMGTKDPGAPEAETESVEAQDAEVQDAEVQDADAGPEDAPEPLGPAANVAVALVVTAFGAAGCLASWFLGVGTPAEPEAGTWPLVVCAAITVLGCVLLGTARRTADTEAFSAASWKILAGVGTMAGFIALIGTIGFEIPSALLAFVWLRFLGGESWRLSAVASVLIVAAFYAVFVGLLSVPIPHLF